MGCVFERAESNAEDDAPVTYGVPEIWIEAETVSGRVGGRSLRPGEIWLELEQLDLGARRVTVEYDWPDGSSLSATFRYGEQRQTVEM